MSFVIDNDVDNMRLEIDFHGSDVVLDDNGDFIRLFVDNKQVRILDSDLHDFDVLSANFIKLLQEIDSNDKKDNNIDTV